MAMKILFPGAKFHTALGCLVTKRSSNEEITYWNWCRGRNNLDGVRRTKKPALIGSEHKLP
jgi:hypothetical protein